MLQAFVRVTSARVLHWITLNLVRTELLYNQGVLLSSLFLAH